MTPYWPSLLGGMLIGLAATLLLLLNGRTAGVSGILGRLLAQPMDDLFGLAACLDSAGSRSR
jgi:uncharacterized membrane protein YedE/YeeE